MTIPNTLFCTVVNDDYVRGLCVMLFSMHKHIKDFKEFPLKVYFNQQISPLSFENQKNIKRIHSNTEFVDVPIDTDSVESVFLKRKEYQSTYLFFQPFAENDYDQVVCFDADMICLSDIIPILENPYPGIQGVGEFEPNPFYFCINRICRKLNGSTMLSQPGFYLSKLERILGERLNLENSCKNKLKNFFTTWISLLNKKAPNFLLYPKSPINTGFFIIGKQTLNKNYLEALTDEAKCFLENHDEKMILLGDQPVINWLKHKRKIPLRLLNYNLNINFNIFSNYHSSPFENAKIFHFTGQFKPWLEAQKKVKPEIYQLHPYKIWVKYKKEMLKATENLNCFHNL